MWRILCIFVLFTCFSCSTTSSDLTLSEPVKEWQLNASCEQIYRAYARYAKDNYTINGYSYSGNRVIESYLSRDALQAAIEVKLTGNPLVQVSFIYIELSESKNITSVKAWGLNSHYYEELENFKNLLPIRQ